MLDYKLDIQISIIMIQLAFQTESQEKMNNSQEKIHPYKSSSYVFSNQILIQNPAQKQNQSLLYVPAYLRLNIKSFKQIQISKCTGTIQTNILLDLDITNLPSQIIDVIKKNLKLELLNQQNSIINLSAEEYASNLDQVYIRKRNFLSYNIKKTLTARGIVSVIWTPFEVFRLVVSIKIPPIEIEDAEAINNLYKSLFKNGENKKSNSFSFSIMFNLMDYVYNLERIDNKGSLVKDMAQVWYGQDSHVGQYQLAQRIMVNEYTNKKAAKVIIEDGKQKTDNITQSCFVKYCQRLHPNSQRPQKLLSQEEEQKLIQQQKQDQLEPSFCVAHFTIPLHRMPIVSIFSLMIPGYILGLISLVIFFQPTGKDTLADKVGGIATIILAYIALIPVVRSQIPPTPKLTIVQVVGYSEILVTVLCLVDSFVGSVREEIIEFVWYENGFLLASLIIQAMATLILLSSIGIFYFRWLPMYSIKTGRRIELNTDQWKNTQCDEWLNERRQKNNMEISLLN